MLSKICPTRNFHFQRRAVTFHPIVPTFDITNRPIVAYMSSLPHNIITCYIYTTSQHIDILHTMKHHTSLYNIPYTMMPPIFHMWSSCLTNAHHYLSYIRVCPFYLCCFPCMIFIIIYLITYLYFYYYLLYTYIMY